MDHRYPTTKTGAAIFLRSASECIDIEDGYNDHKAEQLLVALADLLIAEVRVSSCIADIGFDGCQGEDSSIGGVPCSSSPEI